MREYKLFFLPRSAFGSDCPGEEEKEKAHTRVYRARFSALDGRKAFGFIIPFAYANELRRNVTLWKDY